MKGNYLRRTVGTALAGEAWRGSDPAVVGAVEVSPAGNVVLRVGRTTAAGRGFGQTEHVVLTVDEASELVHAIDEATGGRAVPAARASS